jgi:hypothetical protein
MRGPPPCVHHTGLGIVVAHRFARLLGYDDDSPKHTPTPNPNHRPTMASFKFQSTPFTVESPDVAYTEEEIVAKYSYETVVVEGAKVSSAGGRHRSGW